MSKSTATSPLLVLTLSLTTVGAARAQEPFDAGTVLLEAGPFLAQPAGISSEPYFETSYGGLLGAGLQLTDAFSGHLTLRYYLPQVQGELDAGLWDASLSMRYGTSVADLLRLYGDVGYFVRRLAAEDFIDSVPIDSVTDVSHGPLLGFGASFPLTDSIALGPHVEYLTTTGDLFERGWLNASARLTVGF